METGKYDSSLEWRAMFAIGSSIARCILHERDWERLREIEILREREIEIEREIVCVCVCVCVCVGL